MFRMLDFSFIFGFGFIMASSAYVYKQILCDNGNILSFWYKFLNNNIGENRGEFKMPINWLWKPLYACAYCVSGQFALWGYVIFQYKNYSFGEHILTIITSIFFTDVIYKLWEQTKKKRR